MDILLFAVSVFIVLCITVTAIASVAVIAFVVMFLQEHLNKPKIRSLIMSDFVSKESRLAV